MILVAVLGLGLLAGSAYAGYWYGTQQVQPAEKPTPVVSQPVSTPTPEPTPTPALGKDCAVNGESPTDFDMTTGKFVPEGKPCCEGLKTIYPKRESCLDDLERGLSVEVTGSRGICRPCGDGVCNPEYEDRCNCPGDCE